MYIALNKKTIANYKEKLYRGQNVRKEKYKLKKFWENGNNRKGKNKQINIALFFLNGFIFFKRRKSWNRFITKGNDEIIPVKFILNANSNEDLISTNLDIENISQIPNEKEVLILPLSCFEIENIKEVIDNNIKI